MLLSLAAAVSLAAQAQFAMPELPKLVISGRAPVAAQAAARRPQRAWMAGGFGGAPVELVFDRVQWTIKGGINGAPVDLAIDHANSRITGGIGAPVDLVFDWTPDRVNVRGGAGGRLADYVVDWKAGTVRGGIGGPVELAFSLKEGWVRGGAAGFPVDLQYHALSGRLTGGMNGAPVDAVLTNMDLSEVLQNLFLFVRRPLPNRP